MSTVISLIIVGLLIFFTAFFVASEFAIVKVRRTRIDSLADEGHKGAKSVQVLLKNLDGYLSACQLGITITSLGLGWLGEPAIDDLLHPLIGHLPVSHAISTTISFILAFSLITFLHVVLGELAPKTLAIQKAEQVSLYIAKPLILFYKLMYPFIWVLNGSANLLTRQLGVGTASESEVAHSEEELRLILSESYQKGEINKSEYQYVDRIFEFDNRTAKEIMIPRTEVVCLFKDKPFSENLEVMREEKFTRYPVGEGDKDHIVGLVNIKELFHADIQEAEPLETYVRPILTVFENIPIHDLLIKMQKETIHMAILVDEYGGTSGLVTVEDILEEIVGEIRDEFDADERPPFEPIGNGTVLIEGKVLIAEVNDYFYLDIEDEEVDTIGGWILTEEMEASEGTEVVRGNVTFKVKEMDGHQVKLVEAKKH